MLTKDKNNGIIVLETQKEMMFNERVYDKSLMD
jgi:hypothetical protein